MGTALRNYKNKSKGNKLSDGKGVVGTGRLADSTIDRMQTYYGYTICNNKDNTKEIQKAIWAMILGPESEINDEQHGFYTKTPDTWCKYQRDQ